jgi:hypothetical protein
MRALIKNAQLRLMYKLIPNTHIKPVYSVYSTCGDSDLFDENGNRLIISDYTITLPESTVF